MPAFHEPSIGRAPQAPAAYRLLRGERVIFIGMALDLRASLAEHYDGREGECTRRASAFEYELTDDPVELQRRWLAAHAAANAGSLPECNERQRKHRAPPRGI